MFEESKARSVVKALSWRTIATLTTTVLVFVFTRRVDLAVTVGAVEAIAKIMLYFVHERVWDKLTFGRTAGTTVATPPPGPGDATATGPTGGVYRSSVSVFKEPA